MRHLHLLSGMVDLLSPMLSLLKLPFTGSMGVVPEVASRQHLEKITYVVEKALNDAGLGFNDLDGIAVTVGPGLIGALLVGVAAAKAYSYALRIPLIPVHHLEAHLYANFLAHKELAPPLICLVVSGGHTSLILLKNHLEYEILGATRDDAAGEAFDKIARVLGLPYPGGPALEELAREGDPQAVHFPRAWLGKDSLEFSFSGLKTAVLNYLKNNCEEGKESFLPDVAASFQAAVIEVLVEKTIMAAKKSGVPDVCLAGGLQLTPHCVNSLNRRQARRASGSISPTRYYVQIMLRWWPVRVIITIWPEILLPSPRKPVPITR